MLIQLESTKRSILDVQGFVDDMCKGFAIAKCSVPCSGDLITTIGDGLSRVTVVEPFPSGWHRSKYFNAGLFLGFNVQQAGLIGTRLGKNDFYLCAAVLKNERLFQLYGADFVKAFQVLSHAS